MKKGDKTDMADLKFQRGNTAQLAAEPIQDGTISFDTEKKALYIDTDTERAELQSSGSYVKGVTYPVTVDGNGIMSIAKATTSLDGLMSSTDKVTLENKQDGFIKYNILETICEDIVMESGVTTHTFATAPTLVVGQDYLLKYDLYLSDGTPNTIFCNHTIAQAFANGSKVKVRWLTAAVSGVVSLEDVTLIDDFRSDGQVSHISIYKIEIVTTDETVRLIASMEGKNTKVSGLYAHAEGLSTSARGSYSHAEGSYSDAYGANAHTEGYNTKASAYAAHAEGSNTVASASCAHAEGGYFTDTAASTASAYAAHAEGISTTASGKYSHSEGASTIASGESSHAEGRNSKATNLRAHAEGYYCTASATNSHAEGYYGIANGTNSHAEGYSTRAYGTSSHAQNAANISAGYSSHAEGLQTIAGPAYILKVESCDPATKTFVFDTTFTDFSTSFAKLTTGITLYVQNVYYLNDANWFSIASINADTHSVVVSGTIPTEKFTPGYAVPLIAYETNAPSHSEGRHTIANGSCSHAEGRDNQALGDYSHTEGYINISSGYGSHTEGIRNIASGNSCHAEGGGCKATGDTSHAEGISTTASSYYTHAEGCHTIAKGFSAHAEGIGTIADGQHSHAEGIYSVANNDLSHTEGHSTLVGADAVLKISAVDTATKTLTVDTTHITYQEHLSDFRVGMTVCAINYTEHDNGVSTKNNLEFTIASKDDTAHTIVVNEEIPSGYTIKYIYDPRISGKGGHAEGSSTICMKNGCHSEGEHTIAMGNYSHAEGYNTAARGVGSHSEGGNTIATADYSHAQGYYTTSDNFGAFTTGKYNKPLDGGTSAQYSIGDAFVIGNGTSDTARSNAYRVTYNGEVFASYNFNSAGADYAEYFEWLDGNINNEDRVGCFVTLDGDKIHIANTNDYVLGIVSGHPCIIGNSDEDWLGKNKYDDFGRVLQEEVVVPVTSTYASCEETQEDLTNASKEQIENVDYATHIEADEHKINESIHVLQNVINSEYDSTREYVSRKDRPEWAAIGMVGVLAVRDDGTCKVNGYCKVADGGIATSTTGEMTIEDGKIVKGYRVIKRVSDNVIKVVLK